jgi:hypothetical protein
LPKKFNVHLCQKVPFVVACFQASAAPRSENSDSKLALFVFLQLLKQAPAGKGYLEKVSNR